MLSKLKDLIKTLRCAGEPSGLVPRPPATSATLGDGIIIISAPTTRAKIAEVEGESWAQNFRSASQVAEAGSAWAASKDNQGYELIAIYGIDGLHRYLVLQTGEVVFSRAHAAPNKIEAAKRAGFRVI